MNRLAYVVVSFVAGLCLVLGPASAQTVEELKKELAAKDAEIARLRDQVRQMESYGAAPARSVAAQPAYGPAPSPDEDELDRALDQTLIREGALVLAPFTYELTPSVSWAHWDKVQQPFVENSYSAGLGFRMGLPWRSQVSIGVPYVWNDLREGGDRRGPWRRWGSFFQGTAARDRDAACAAWLCRVDLANEPGVLFRAHPLCLRIPRRSDGLEAARPFGRVCQRILLLVAFARGCRHHS
jgi:hypothetical protein